MIESLQFKKKESFGGIRLALLAIYAVVDNVYISIPILMASFFLSFFRKGKVTQ